MVSTIIVKTPVLEGIGALFAEHALSRKTVLLFDTNTRKLFGEAIRSQLASEGFTVHELLVPAREQSKSMRVAWRLYGEMIAGGVDRSWNLLAVGGGVVGDLGGYLAAGYYRGIPVVQVPTTLLAMTDSSIGGKVAINHPQGKNLIGFFHLPEMVLIDPAMLQTLPRREILAGMAEVVKYGFIADAAFFERLEYHFAAICRLEEPYLSDAVKTSAEIKADVVKRDFRETTGLRATLNFGHTFAHGLEKLADYRHLRHGEAVLFGMACALSLSYHLGCLDRQSFERGTKLLQAFDIAPAIRQQYFQGIDSITLLAAMASDKKKQDNSLRFVLLESIGHAFLYDKPVDNRLVIEAITQAQCMLSC